MPGAGTASMATALRSGTGEAAATGDLRPAVEFDRVTLTLGARAVLREVTFTLRRGEFIGILGPNGAGKTTLTRALLGLVRPSAGVIRVLGRVPRLGDPLLGYMPQSRLAPPAARLSGWDYVASAAEGTRWGLPTLDPATRRDVEAAIAAVEGEALARRPLAELSGGERQRLLIAQALLGQPQILLLDEPLVSLDPRHQIAVVELAKRLNRERGLTLLFSAHELTPLLGAVDRILYLGNGRAAVGTVDEVVTGEVLSSLYGFEVDVVRAGGRIFVIAGGRREGAEGAGEGRGEIGRPGPEGADATV